MKKFLFVLLFLLPLLANAEPTVYPPLEPESYATFVDATVAAAFKMYQESDVYEYTGLILETDLHTFRVSTPNTSWNAGSVGTQFNNLWQGYTIVAHYHSHVCMPVHAFPGVFSDTDVALYARYSTIGVLLDMCSGRVLEFAPGVDAEDYEFPDNTFGARGRQLGSIVVWRIPSNHETVLSPYAVNGP